MSKQQTDLWLGFSDSEKRHLSILFSFHHTINFAEPIISEFFYELKESGYDCPSYNIIEKIIEKCKNRGSLLQIDEFPNTVLIKILPDLSFFLKKHMADNLNKNQIVKIEIAFVNYYDWLSEQLYNMYYGTPSEEHQVNINFIYYEYENLLHALKLSIKHCRYDFSNIYLMLNTFLSATRRHLERLKLGEELLKELEPLENKKSSSDYRFSLVDIYDSIGASYLDLFQFSKAELFFTQAFNKYEQFGLQKKYPAAYRSLYQNLAAVTSFQNKWEVSNRYYGKMLNIAQQFDDDEGIADYHLNIGKNMLNLEQDHEAFIHFNKAAMAYNEIGNKEWEGEAYKYLGLTKISQYQFDAAIEYYEKAEMIFNVLGDQFRQGKILNDLSLLHSSKHEFSEARKFAKKSLSTFLALKDFKEAGIAYIHMCSATLGLGEINHCESYLQKAYTIFSKIEDKQNLKLTLNLAKMIDEKFDTTIYSDLIKRK